MKRKKQNKTPHFNLQPRAYYIFDLKLVMQRKTKFQFGSLFEDHIQKRFET